MIILQIKFLFITDGTKVKKSIQSNLFRTYKEVPLGASEKIIQVGYCHNDIMQTFSFLEIFGGRVSGEYGKAYICVAGNAILSAKSVFPISNCTFRKKNINNKLYIYVILSSYCYLAINGFNGSRFVLEMQEISELPSDTSELHLLKCKYTIIQ